MSREELAPARLQPLHIETLSPQLHGFVRAYVFQLPSGIVPKVEGDPVKEVALELARVIVRLSSDRDRRRRLVAELGEYLRGPGHLPAPSELLQALLVELEALLHPPPAAPEIKVAAVPPLEAPPLPVAASPADAPLPVAASPADAPLPSPPPVAPIAFDDPAPDPTAGDGPSPSGDESACEAPPPAASAPSEPAEPAEPTASSESGAAGEENS